MKTTRQFGIALIIVTLAVISMKGIGKMTEDRSQVSTDKSSATEESFKLATFAGGCFWCMESPYDKLDGVISTVVGYSGGHSENPSYESISTGKTGHLEVIQIQFDPKKITYEVLLEAFWRNIDPTNDKGQFADYGSQYLTAIFYHSDEQKDAAIASKKALAESGKFDKPIVTEIRPEAVFYRAEDYHQDFYKNNPLRYNRYKYGSGRPQFLEKVWGK